MRYLSRAGTQVAKQSSVVEIQVRLLEEGTDCSRPTRGLVLGDGLFELLPTDSYHGNDEHWEFVPGSIVRVKEVRNINGTYLLAVARDSCSGIVG